MKKYLIVLAAAVVALAGCKPSEKEGSKYTSLKFKETSIEMSIGETAKLRVIYEPTTLEAPVCEWSTSDSTAVTVDQNGNIEAVAEGQANITAKHGDLTAACQVTVKDARSLVTWAGIARFSDIEPYEDKTYDLTLSDGVTYKCQYGGATYYMWDDGVSLDDKGHLQGEGYMFILENVPTFVIAEGADAGAGVGSPIYFMDKDFNPADTAYSYCIPAGSLGSVDALVSYLSDTTEAAAAYEDVFKGPSLAILSDGNLYYPSFGGILNKGYVYGNYKEMRAFDFSITWADGYHGLALDETGEDLKQPYEWDTVTINYYLGNESQAPRHTMVKAPVRNIKALDKPMKLNNNSKVLLKK